MGFFGNTDVKGLQVLFKDNRHVAFRLLPVRHTCLTELHPNDKEIALRGWKDYFKNHYSFKGYKNISAGEATLSFERDIVLNLNNVIPKDKLPQEGGDLKQHADIGRSRFRQIVAKPQSSTMSDKMTNTLIVSFFLSLVLLLIIFGKAGI